MFKSTPGMIVRQFSRAGRKGSCFIFEPRWGVASNMERAFKSFSETMNQLKAGFHSIACTTLTGKDEGIQQLFWKVAGGSEGVTSVQGGSMFDGECVIMVNRDVCAGVMRRTRTKEHLNSEPVGTIYWYSAGTLRFRTSPSNLHYLWPSNVYLMRN